MKKLIFANIALILVIVIFSGCSVASFDRNLLIPTNGSISPRLPRLSFQGESSKMRLSDDRELTGNTKMYTLFNRELDNICIRKGDNAGYIDVVVTLQESNLNMGVAIFSGALFFVPNIFGFPIRQTINQLEVEIIISSIEEEMVWKKIYYREKRYNETLYKPSVNVNEKYILMFRDMLLEFKNDLQADASDVSQLLSQ